MIELSEDIARNINNAFDEGVPVLVATATKAGLPDLVFKGSMMVFDQEHMAFWERALGQTLRNLQENPNLVAMYRNPATRVAYKIFGVAELHQTGDLRQQIMDKTIEAELSRDPERKGWGVLIRVDKIQQGPNVLMQRE